MIQAFVKTIVILQLGRKFLNLKSVASRTAHSLAYLVEFTKNLQTEIEFKLQVFDF